MAKLAKSVLKGIVKDCLVEILSEGLLGKQGSLPKANMTKKKPQTRSQRTSSNPKFQKKIQETTSALTQDPIMAAIFEDTARTTLQEQARNESSPVSRRNDFSYDDEADESETVESLFEGSSNWAQLAFAEKKNV